MDSLTIEKTTIMTRCPVCGKTNEITINENDYWAWRRGEDAETVFPYLSETEREMLINGTCPNCQSSAN